MGLIGYTAGVILPLLLCLVILAYIVELGAAFVAIVVLVVVLVCLGAIVAGSRRPA